MMPRTPVLMFLWVLAQGLFPVISSAQELNWAQKMFDRANINFGTVARGADCGTRVKVRNLYQETIYITGVSTACSCANAQMSDTELAAGETAFLDIRMDTVRFMRERKTAAIIQLSEPTKGLAMEVRIPLEVYIRTDVVLQPGSVNFGTIEVGKGALQTVVVSYAGRPDWKILQATCKNPNVIPEVLETSRAGGTANYELRVTLKPDAPAGLVREQIVLLTDDAGSPQVPVAVQGSVEADVTMSPGSLQFGTLKPGQSKTVNLIVRGRKPLQIERLEREQSDNTLKVKLPKDLKLVHVLPITFTAPEFGGLIDEVLTINLVGRQQPLEVRVQAKVDAPLKPITEKDTPSTDAPIPSTVETTTPVPAVPTAAPQSLPAEEFSAPVETPAATDSPGDLSTPPETPANVPATPEIPESIPSPPTAGAPEPTATDDPFGDTP